jgi:hypothetical protein
LWRLCKGFQGFSADYFESICSDFDPEMPFLASLLKHCFAKYGTVRFACYPVGFLLIGVVTGVYEPCQKAAPFSNERLN